MVSSTDACRWMVTIILPPGTPRVIGVSYDAGPTSSGTPGIVGVCTAGFSDLKLDVDVTLAEEATCRGMRRGGGGRLCRITPDEWWGDSVDGERCTGEDGWRECGGRKCVAVVDFGKRKPALLMHRISARSVDRDSDLVVSWGRVSCVVGCGILASFLGF